jgi:error-prone DNA polymerase
MRKKEGRVVLGVQSYFSLGRGIYSPEDWVRWASSQGVSTLGLWDWNNLYGMMRFLAAAEEYAIQPLVGAILAPEDEVVLRAVCLGKAGFARLNGILSKILDGRLDRAGLLEDLYQGGWEGLALLFHDQDVGAFLAGRSSQNLFGALYYGRPTRGIQHWCDQRGVASLACMDAVARAEEDQEFYRLLRAMEENTTISALPEEEVLLEHQWMPPWDGFYDYYRPFPGALAELYRLAARTRTQELVPDRFVFPAFGGLSEDQAFTRLQQLCFQGAQERYGGVREDVQARLDYELSIIRRKGFTSYFLVVHDIVSRFPRTCGRGSSAASIVSYLLFITHVDPLRYNLFFERFLNEGRVDPPDIDVDFPWDEREEVLRYVFKTYPGRSAMVADHVTFARRSTLRDPAKAYGLDKEEIDRLMVPLRLGKLDEIPDYLLRAAGRIKGRPHFLGTHPGGVVITPGSIYQHTHVQTSPLGWPVIAWEKDGAEEAGLVKIDLLGNRSLAVLRDSLALINRTRRPPLEWARFQPYTDEQTVELIESGDTLGVFYVESPATRQLLQKMGRGDYEHLVIASSIIRPAANRYIDAYLSRLHGHPWKAVDPEMEEVLGETKGIMAYQEDVSRVAIAIAGFDAVKADDLRRILSKKHKARKLADYKEQFFQGGTQRGRTAATMETIWNMILSFAGYSFNKPHSASYALVSMRLAYIKRHYPLAFFASVINNGGGFYSRQVYLNAVKRRGYRVLPPDINASRACFTLEDGGLRVGLSQLADLDKVFLQRLLQEREERGPFESLENFLLRTQPKLAQMRVLIRSGALDSLAGKYNRPQLFWIFFYASKDSLFPLLPSPPVNIKDYPVSTKLRDELRYLGLVVSDFPLNLFRPRVRQTLPRLRRQNLPVIDSRMLEGVVGRFVAYPGLLVTRKEVRTKNREAMSFVSFEDNFGMVEAVAFPDCWDRVSGILDEGMAFLVSGKVTESFGARMLELEEVLSMNRPVVD